MTVKNFKPIEQGNAKIIKEVCMPTLQLTLLRYEAIAEFYSKEPYCINIRLTQYEEFDSFEQILRVRKWIPNKSISSWSIYSMNRESLAEEDNGFVFRNTIWKRDLDVKKVKNANEKDKKLMLNDWPNIEIKNVYVQSSSSLVKALDDLDIIISNGISLVSRNPNISEWQDTEIMRLYDWGNVTATWSPVKENKDLDTWITEFCKEFEKCIESNSISVYQMNLDYIYPTENYKNIICGEGIKDNC